MMLCHLGLRNQSGRYSNGTSNVTKLITTDILQHGQKKKVIAVWWGRMIIFGITFAIQPARWVS